MSSSALIGAADAAEPASPAATEDGPLTDPAITALLAGGVSDGDRLRALPGVASASPLGGDIWTVELRDGASYWNVADAAVRAGVARYLEPDVPLQLDAVVTDPGYPDLWGLDNTNDVDVDAPEAWGVTRGSADVLVAVVDTGLDITHPDLVERIWTNPGEIPDNGVDDDLNGLTDDVHGWDFHHDDATVYDAADGDAHGTHVAGSIAASADGAGVVGVAPEVTLLPLKFIGPEGNGSTSDAIWAIRYAAWAGADIVNASWGGPTSSRALRDTIETSGVLLVAAAGNEGADNDTTPSYPANYDLDNVLSVTAIAADGSVPSFANTGATTVDLGAPGSRIVSTWPGGSWAYSSGTSMAAPYVSGVAALVAAVAPGAAATQLAAWLTSTIEPLPSLDRRTVTGGVVDADGALAAAAPSEPQPATAPTTEPTTEPSPEPTTEPVVEDPVTEPVVEQPVDDTEDGSAPFTQRLAGEDRYATAAAAVRHGFPHGASTVYVATGQHHADALAGGAAAAHDGAPVVPVMRDTIPAASAGVLSELRPARIVVLGGTSAVSDEVVDQLRRHTGAVVARVSGADRYATAAAVSRSVFPVGTSQVVLATGGGYADALVGTGVADTLGGPVLLTAPGDLGAATSSELQRLAPERVVVLGGRAAIADHLLHQVEAATGAEVVRVSGADRFETGALATSTFVPEVSTVYVATGAGFADALTAGPVAAIGAGALLLAPRTGPVPAGVLEELRDRAPQRLVLIGGLAAIDDDVASQLCAAAGTC